MVQEVRHALMQSTRARKDPRGGYTIITTRAWRSRFVYVNGRPRTLFHRPSKVQESLDRFFDLAGASTFFLLFLSSRKSESLLTSYLHSPSLI